MLKKLVSQVELLESHIIPIKFATSANYEKKKKGFFFGAAIRLKAQYILQQFN